MELAQRLQRIPPYPFREIAALKSQMIAEGKEPIDLGIGDPDMPTAGFVIDAIHRFEIGITDSDFVIDSHLDCFFERHLLLQVRCRAVCEQ